MFVIEVGVGEFVGYRESFFFFIVVYLGRLKYLSLIFLNCWLLLVVGVYVLECN